MTLRQGNSLPTGKRRGQLRYYLRAAMREPWGKKVVRFWAGRWFWSAGKLGPVPVMYDYTYWPKRAWWWAPWKLTNPVWPWFWRGGDEHGRRTIVIQPPLLGAFIFPVSAPCATCATEGECDAHR